MRCGLAFALLLAACPTAGDDDDSAIDDDDATGDDDDGTPTTGTLALTFEIDEDWAAEMDEPAIGPFSGNVYNADEVTGAGPDDGAVVLASIYVAEVDLTSLGPTSVLFTTKEIPTGWVNILGFIDSDGNAGPDENPDDGDPVTLPNQNEFELVGPDTTANVFFGFLNP
jgi:hypothetical protein